MTILGCVQGGMPRCRLNGKISDDGPFGMMDPLVCQRPEKTLSAFDFISARSGGSQSCVCPSGFMPVCKNTNRLSLCPDGTVANRTLTRLPPYLEACISKQFA